MEKSWKKYKVWEEQKRLQSCHQALVGQFFLNANLVWLLLVPLQPDTGISSTCVSWRLKKSGFCKRTAENVSRCSSCSNKRHPREGDPRRRYLPGRLCSWHSFLISSSGGCEQLTKSRAKAQARAPTANGRMMEEVSIMVAYDAHVFSQLCDEDFLANLVAVSKPRSVVGVPLTPLPIVLKVMLFAAAQSSCWKLFVFFFWVPSQQFAFVCQWD